MKRKRFTEEQIAFALRQVEDEETGIHRTRRAVDIGVTRRDKTVMVARH